MLSKGQIKQFRQQLLDLQQELENLLSLSESASDTVSLDQTKVGRLSRMDALQQQAMAQANRAQHQQHLKQVHEALVAIKEGYYGFCEECGQDIPIARLEARPESIYCVDCKNKLES